MKYKVGDSVFFVESQKKVRTGIVIGVAGGRHKRRLRRYPHTQQKDHTTDLWYLLCGQFYNVRNCFANCMKEEFGITCLDRINRYFHSL